MNEVYMNEQKIDSLSFEELVVFLEKTTEEFNELKKEANEALRVHADGGDATTADVLELTLKEWSAKFASIQDIYRRMAGIQTGQDNLLK